MNLLYHPKLRTS
uniref:Uncharacterized protein n=1 Tax=Arundo donax TaxID=35708 RepID=A0A0A9BW34_ARUDO